MPLVKFLERRVRLTGLGVIFIAYVTAVLCLAVFAIASGVARYGW